MGLSRALLLAGLACGAIAAPAAAQSSPPAPVASARQDEDERLFAMLNAFARAQEALDPLGAVARGSNSDPQQLQRLFSDELAAAQRAELQRELAAVARIDRTRLSPERQLLNRISCAPHRRATCATSSGDSVSPPDRCTA